MLIGTDIITKPKIIRNIYNKITIVEGWSKKNLNKILSNSFNEFENFNYNDILADTYFINSNFDFDKSEMESLL